ncbi:MAG: desulfoferrodoxin [Eubacteriaceae bacterium]|nr:desulfoferrodoxin [Eubacteriaceae bacterium]
MEQKFFICENCGNIYAEVKGGGAKVMCCGQKMTQIEPNSSGASVEKHMPVYEVKDNIVTVTVGEVIHPMSEEHLIQWISIQTNKGNQRKVLSADGEPKAQFVLLEGEEIEAVYEYCNLHGLWKAEK